MQLEKYKKEYEEKGITVIPNVFTEEECEMMKKAAYATRPGDIVGAGYPHSPSEAAKNKLSLIFFPALTGNYLNDVRTDERMQEIVRYFLGDDVKQVNNQIYFREAGDEDEFAWHQDICFRTPSNRFPGIKDGYLQTIIAVDDITEDNGAIEFVPGTHREVTKYGRPSVKRGLRNFNREGIRGEKYKAPKGSVLLWTCLTLHGSEANTSESIA